MIVILWPNPQCAHKEMRRPLPLLLSPSFFYGGDTVTSSSWLQVNFLSATARHSSLEIVQGSHITPRLLFIVRSIPCWGLKHWTRFLLYKGSFFFKEIFYTISYLQCTRISRHVKDKNILKKIVQCICVYNVCILHTLKKFFSEVLFQIFNKNQKR